MLVLAGHCGESPPLALPLQRSPRPRVLAESTGKKESGRWKSNPGGYALPVPFPPSECLIFPFVFLGTLVIGYEKALISMITTKQEPQCFCFLIAKAKQVMPDIPRPHLHRTPPTPKCCKLAKGHIAQQPNSQLSCHFAFALPPVVSREEPPDPSALPLNGPLKYTSEPRTRGLLTAAHSAVLAFISLLRMHHLGSRSSVSRMCLWLGVLTV